MIFGGSLPTQNVKRKTGDGIINPKILLKASVLNPVSCILYPLNP